VIVPIYLFHRYEVDAVAKSVGGVDFNYGLRGDGAPAAQPVDPSSQRRALAALLETLAPEVLDLPDALINQLSTGMDGSPDPQYETELFSPSRTPVFDIAAAAEAAVDITLGDLLEPSRLERVADQGARDPAALGVTELMTRAVDYVFGDSPRSGREGQLRRTVRARLVVKLAQVLVNKDVTPTVAAATRVAMDGIGQRLAALKSADPADLAQARYLSGIILNPSHDSLAVLAESDRKRGVAPPPGMPIGAEGGEDGWFSEGLAERP
jgi:hypothetical protein